MRKRQLPQLERFWITTLVERLKAKEEAGQHKEETKKEDKDKEQKTKKVQAVRKTPY